MLRFCLIAFLSVFIFVPSISKAQMSKEQEKIWKKKKKTMSVEAFKKKVEGFETLNNENQRLQREVAAAEKALAQQQKALDSLRNALASKGTTPKQAQAQSSDVKDDYSKGKVFRVQVGAFRNKDLMKYVGHRRFHAEEDQDGTKKYTIAVFRDYWEADLFKKYMHEMGVKDAWVVAYIDGKRAQIEEVLSAEDVQAVKDGEDKNTIDE